MRWIKWILIAIVGVLAATFLALYVASDGASGRGDNRARIVIERPAAQVYPWLTEADRLTQWLGGLVASEPITEGGLKVGARSREIVEMEGRRTEMESVVTGFVPDSLLALTITGEGFEVHATYTLQETGGKSTLSYAGQFQFHPFFLRLFAPFIGASAQKKLIEDLNTLKARVEAEKTAVPDTTSQ